MGLSKPRVSFSVTSINFGTIDVGASATTQYYDVYVPGDPSTVTAAIHMSISFKEGTNASEIRQGSWVWVSTTLTGGKIRIASIGGAEASIGSIVAGTSVNVGTNIVVPSAATTAGPFTFYFHHRYQYTGDDYDYAG